MIEAIFAHKRESLLLFAILFPALVGPRVLAATGHEAIWMSGKSISFPELLYLRLGKNGSRDLKNACRHDVFFMRPLRISSLCGHPGGRYDRLAG